MKLPIPENLNWIHNRIALLTVVGSHAYGTNTKESDIDYKGVCIPPQEYYLGLNTFNEYSNTGGKVWKNTVNDIDVSIMHINKFVKDAINGVPNNIEILFTNWEHIIQINDFGKELIDRRHDFLSKSIKAKFVGYAVQQRHKMITKKNNRTGRQDLVEKFGYDTKYAQHAIRLLTGAIEILTTGDFSTFRPNRHELLDVRQGKYTLEQILIIIDDLYDELNNIHKTSTAVPKTPDYNKINKWLINLNRKALNI